MSNNIEKRLEALEHPQDKPNIRIATLHPGEACPEARPDEILIIDDIPRSHEEDA